jgi:hypothetical protein
VPAPSDNNDVASCVIEVADQKKDQESEPVTLNDVTPVVKPESPLQSIEIAGHLFQLGKDPETDRELQTLKLIVERESGHKQWEKQLINFSVLASLILMNLFMGSRSTKSIVGIANCSGGYWALWGGFLVICGLVTVWVVHRARQEQHLKKKYGNINLVKSDLIFDAKTITIIVCLGFFGGLLAGALGLGGGVIFNPVLLTLGLPPLVASASGLFLVTISKTATSIMYFVYGYLPI